VNELNNLNKLIGRGTRMIFS